MIPGTSSAASANCWRLARDKSVRISRQAADWASSLRLMEAPIDRLTALTLPPPGAASAGTPERNRLGCARPCRGRRRRRGSRPTSARRGSRRSSRDRQVSLLLISGSKVRALVRPPSKQPKMKTEYDARLCGALCDCHDTSGFLPAFDRKALCRLNLHAVKTLHFEVPEHFRVR